VSTADGDVLKAVAEFVLNDGSIVQNVFYYLASFAAVQSDAAVLAAIIGNIEDIYAEIVSDVSSTVAVNPTEVSEIAWDSGTGKWEVVRAVGTDTPTIVFTGAGDVLPNQNAMVIVANTTRPKSRGRKFFFAIPEGIQDEGDLESTAVADLVDAGADWINDTTISAGNDLVPGVPRTNNDVFLEFTMAIVNSIIGSQRRRKPGVGA
jgi:hypothetical protein